MAVKDGKLYTLGWADKKDTVYCLDANTGREIRAYSYACGAGQYPGPRATPTVHEGSVYTLSREGDLFCFDADNGRLRWQKHLKRDYGIRGIQRGFSGSVVISGDLIILNAGAPVWLSIKKRDEKFGADPLLELKDNRLSRVWQNRNMRSHFPSPVYRNG